MPAGTTPLVTSVGFTVKVPPLQIVAAIAEIDGLGLTVIVTTNGAPAQVPNAADVNGVTVYVAVWKVFVLLTNVPEIVVGLPLLAVPPVIPPVTVGDVHV